MFGSKNHYELALSGLLLESGVQALAVEQARRPALDGVTLKNFDLMLNGYDAVYALELKGRRERPWVSRTDLFSLMGWKRLLKGCAVPALLFAFYTPPFETAGRVSELDCTLHETPAGAYRFCLLGLEDAQRLAKPRSERWGTFGFEWQAFARAVTPLEAIVALPAAMAPCAVRSG
jgi:hypothetical protein